MAGAGAKKFPAFSKLSSDDVNNYLADQVVMRFATTAARDAAFGGIGEPTLSEGMTAYIDDLNLLQTYDGSNWVGVASLLSPSFTGTPTAPTATAGTNTTQLATTAFTTTAVGALGTWTSFTPSYTNLGTGNGSNIGFFTVINKMLWVKTLFTLGSTSSVGDPVFLTLPNSYTLDTTCQSPVGTAVMEDVGVATYFGLVLVRSSTTVQPFVSNASGTYGTFNSVNGTRPFSSFSGDKYAMDFMVKIL
jgi:hypothetical protein